MTNPVRSTILVTGGNILVKGFAFLAIILLMRSFDPAAFGQIMTMVSLMSILPVFMDFGSGSSFLRIFPTLKTLGLNDRRHDLFGAALMFRCVVGPILVILGITFSKPIAALLLKDSQAYPIVILAFTGGFAASFFHFLQVFFQSDEKFISLIITQFIDALIKAGGAALILLFLIKPTVFSGVSIYALAPLLATVVVYIARFSSMPRPKIPEKELFKTFSHFSFWYMVSAASIMIFMNFDYLILAAARPAEDVGYYGSAYRLGTMFFLLVQAINTVLMPYVGRLTDAVSVLSFFKKAQIRTFILCLLVLPAVLMGPWIIRLIAGDSYLPAVATYYWVAIDQVAQLLFTPLMVVLFALNRPKFLAGYVVLEMTLNIIGDLIVVNTWGPAGVAAVTFFVRMIIGLAGTIHVWSGLKNRDGFLRSVTGD